MMENHHRNGNGTNGTSKAPEKRRKKRRDYSAMDSDKLLYNGGMAQKSEKKGSSESCLTWIADEQLVHETAEYGTNKKSVTDSLEEQRRRVRLVDRYGGEVEKAAIDAKTEEERNELKHKYDSLSTTANKRLGCLKDIAQIASLEDLFGSLTNEFAQRGTDLVAGYQKESEPLTDTDGCGVSRGAQSCILAVRQNWKWIAKLLQCSDTHLQHVADYHQFFHDVHEYEVWMPIELNKATEKVQRDDSFKGSKEDADRLLVELKEVLVIFLHWQGKTDNLFDRSRRVVPVQLRTQKVDHQRPVSSLCDYKTNEIKVSEGEELTLLDNSKTKSWKVRNMHLHEASVPSVICVIPGPDPAAVSAALKLRVQLLYVWTDNVKRIGKTVIWFLNILLREWTANEAKMIKSMPADKKKEVSTCLDHIESDLSPYWSEYPDYKTLQEKINELRKLLAQEGEEKESDLGNALVVQTAVVDDLLTSYKDLWRNWETCKILTESCRHSEYMLIANQLENMKWIETLELINKWHMGLDFNQNELKGADQTDGQEQEVVEELVEVEQAAPVESAVSNGFEQGIAITSEKISRTAAADQLTHSSQEEKKTFVITGVIDPRTEEEISMQEAVKLGIINSEEGTYVNLATGDSYPIPVAMNAGQIKVEFTSTKKSEEKRRDVGLITIKTQRESRPYTVKAVIDAKTEEKLTVDQAITKGILDQKGGTYKNSMDNTEMCLADAIDSGLLVVEFDEEAEVVEPEVVVKTYAIHAVVDQKRKKRVPFSEAIKLNLLNTETGAYRHNVTGEETYVGDAIKKGFIKATIVHDPTSLDIPTENVMVIDKMESVRSKLLNPLKALAALKKGAKANGK